MGNFQAGILKTTGSKHNSDDPQSVRQKMLGKGSGKREKGELCDVVGSSLRADLQRNCLALICKAHGVPSFGEMIQKRGGEIRLFFLLTSANLWVGSCLSPSGDRTFRFLAAVFLTPDGETFTDDRDRDTCRLPPGNSGLGSREQEGRVLMDPNPFCKC